MGSATSAPTGSPAATQRGNVAHISHPAFYSYFMDAQVPVRTLIERLLDRLLPEPMVRAPGLPSFGRATVTEQPGRRMLHLLSYVPEKRGPNVDMIEEPITLRKVDVALRVDGSEPTSVYLAPDREELAFEVRDGYAHVTIPEMSGYAMVVFEG